MSRVSIPPPEGTVVLQEPWDTGRDSPLPAAALDVTQLLGLAPTHSPAQCRGLGEPQPSILTPQEDDFIL